MDPSASISELEGENIILFGFISSSVSIEVSCHMHYCFFDSVRNQSWDKNYILELIKRRSSVP